MPKIAKSWMGRNDISIEYDIYYSAKLEMFYVKIEPLGESALGFFKSIYEDKEYQKEQELEGLHQQYMRGPMVQLIIARSQEEIKEFAEQFWRIFTKQAVKDEKVILYNFEYTTVEQSTNQFHHRGSNDGETLKMTFKYIVAIKRSFGSKPIYLNAENENWALHYSDYRDRMEIPWSEEMQAFLDEFAKSFDQLVNHMKEYFTVEGKIFELMGKNILSNVKT